jgi:hypothetical protein
VLFRSKATKPPRREPAMNSRRRVVGPPPLQGQLIAILVEKEPGSTSQSFGVRSFVRIWHIASFRCAAEFGRYRGGIADMAGLAAGSTRSRMTLSGNCALRSFITLPAIGTLRLSARYRPPILALIVCLDTKTGGTDANSKLTFRLYHTTPARFLNQSNSMS